jgi:hypothetical protein
MTRYVVRNSAGRYLDATEPGHVGKLVGRWRRTRAAAFLFRSRTLAESFASAWAAHRSGDPTAHVEEA